MASNTMTVTPNFEPPNFDPLQTFSPSCLDYSNSFDFTKTLSLEASVLTTSTPTYEALTKSIADIISSYRISGPGDRYEDTLEPKMLATLRSFVAKQEPINMVVPAYPFKSPNRESKVLGPNPDVGERMSLQHLNSIGARIQQIYPPGGHVTIVSDGLCYNDLLGVSDEEVFDYAKGLHRIVESLGPKHLKFTNLFELMDSDSSPTSAEEYASRVGKLRENLLVSFLPPGYDFDEDIKKDENALLTYRGYIKFLDSDLATFFRAKGMSKSAARKHCSKVARGMIERGKAFSALVANKSPLHIRLSIHASDNTSKLSVTLLPQKRYGTSPVTPWHNTPYLDVENDSLNLGRRPKDGDLTYKVCKDELGLEFLCADVPMYNIVDTKEEVASDQHLKLEPLYPLGLRIQVPKNAPITHSSLNNVSELAKLHSPIIIEGLDPMQYTSEIAHDFRRTNSEILSLEILHKEMSGSVSMGKAASYFVRISALAQETSTASEEQATSYREKEKAGEGIVRPFVETLQEVENIG